MILASFHPKLDLRFPVCKIAQFKEYVKTEMNKSFEDFMQEIISNKISHSALHLPRPGKCWKGVKNRDNVTTVHWNIMV